MPSHEKQGLIFPKPATANAQRKGKSSVKPSNDEAPENPPKASPEMQDDGNSSPSGSTVSFNSRSTEEEKQPEVADATQGAQHFGQILHQALQGVIVAQKRAVDLQEQAVAIQKEALTMLEMAVPEVDEVFTVVTDIMHGLQAKHEGQGGLPASKGGSSLP